MVVVSAPTTRGVVVVFLFAEVDVVEVFDVLVSSSPLPKTVLKVDVTVTPNALVVLEITRVLPSSTSRVVVIRCAKTEVVRKRVVRTAEGVNRILTESKSSIGLASVAE